MLKINLQPQHTSQRSLAVALTVLMMHTVVFTQTWVNTNGPNRKYPSLGLAIGKSGSTQKIWVANDGEQMRYSLDGGSSWTLPSQLFPGAPVQVTCMKSNPNKVLGVRGVAFIHRTINGGLTFPTWNDITPVERPGGGLYVQSIEFSEGDTTRAYFGMDRDCTSATNLFYSEDTGKSFTPQYYFNYDADTYVNSILPYPKSGTYSSYVWAGGSKNDIVEPASPVSSEEENSAPKKQGVWRSTDGGRNWTYNINGLGLGERNVSALAIVIKTSPDSAFLFAAVKKSSEAHIFVSADFGDSWSERTSSSSGMGNGIEIVNALKVQPFSSMTLVAATDEGFAYSSDRGITWSLRNDASWSDKDARYVVFDSAGNTVYLGTFTSVYKSTNLGQTWTDVHSGIVALKTMSIAPHSSEYLAVSNYSAISRFSNSAWEFAKFVGVKQKDGEPRRNFHGEYTAINSLDSNYAYACGDSGLWNDLQYGNDDREAAFYLRTSSGNSWSKVNIPTSSLTPSRFNIVIADPKIGSSRVYMGGNNGITTSWENFFTSTDKGVSWTRAKISSGADRPVLTIAIDTSEGYTVGGYYSRTLYAGLDSNAGLWKSMDGGSSWRNRINSYTIRAIGVNGKNTTTAKTVYAGGDDSLLWKSTDSFATSSRLTNPFRGAKRILMHPSYTRYATYLWVVPANGKKVYRTTNGGTNWIQVTTGLPSNVTINDIRSDPTNNAVIWVATDSGVYKTDPAPEKPTILSVTPSSGDRPVVKWRTIPEDDKKNNYTYQVWRYFRYWDYGNEQWGSPTAAVYIGNTNDTTYTDVSQVINAGVEPPKKAGYFIYGLDAASQSSPSSDSVEIGVDEEPVGNDKSSIGNRDEENIPEEFSLSQNYPNPFNPATEIKYALPVDASVSLKVFDIFGREVATLVSGNKVAGYYSAEFDANKVSSGLYFFRLTATGEGQSFTHVRKMILMK